MVGFVITILDPILNPLLVFPPWAVILIISIVITLIITVIYKFATDQTLMRSLKEEMKKFRTKMKQHKDDPDKMLKLQKEAMSKQMQYMMHSLRPTLFTFLPIILIFGWLNAHLAYQPIMPDEPFEVVAEMDDGISGAVGLSVRPSDSLDIITDAEQPIEEGVAVWRLKADQTGVYELRYTYDNESVSQELLISDQQRYRQPELTPDSDVFERVRIDNNKTVIFSLFGLEIGWLATYIIFSIVLSISLRKLLKVH